MRYSLFQPKSTIEGLIWPGLPEPATANLLAMLAQLEQTQWLDEGSLQSAQFLQLGQLMPFAWKAVPYYQETWSAAGLTPQTPLENLAAWGKVPILTREALQKSGDSICARFLPNGHGPGKVSRSSGSTGRPVTVRRNNIDAFFWHVLTLREHLWHQRYVDGRLAIIRKFDNPALAAPPAGKDIPSWGAPISQAFNTGPAALLDLGATPIHTQAEWLLEKNPDYLLTYPTNAAALARHFIDNRLRLPKLKEVRTLSETLSTETRELCQKAWGVSVKDMYSAQEVGYIALQCPEQDHYHIQSESLLVEILDDQGEPCQAGETGRVIVTSLHSYATPLIRYEVGDYAKVGPACSCGRGLPVLTHIMGRSRNMLVFPNGNRIWPVVRPSQYMEVAPLSQMQMIQHEPDRIEVRMVVHRPPTSVEERALAEAIHASLTYPFQLEFVYMDTLPRTPGGKFEEFISHAG